MGDEKKEKAIFPDFGRNLFLSGSLADDVINKNNNLYDKTAPNETLNQHQAFKENNGVCFRCKRKQKESALFCTFCGAKIKSGKIIIDLNRHAGENACINCGSLYSNLDKFCSNCGCKLTSE